MIGNANLHTTVTFKLFFLSLLIFILHDMHKALEGPTFQRQKYEELMPDK
jgi:hypothetical protein